MTSAASQPPPIEELFGQPPSQQALRDLGALRRAVGCALDRKRRLGHYAVVWQGGVVQTLPPEALPAWTSDVAEASDTAP